MSYWITTEQVAEATGLSLSTLRKWCAAGAINPLCGRRFGRVWRFKRQVIEDEGVIVDEKKIKVFRSQYT